MSIKTSWRPDGTLEVTCGTETILVPPRPSGAGSGTSGGTRRVDPIFGASAFALVIGDSPGRGSLTPRPSASSIGIKSASDMAKHILKGKVDFTWESTEPFYVHDVTKRLGSDVAKSVAINIRLERRA